MYALIASRLIVELIEIDCEVIALFDDIPLHVCIDECISIFIAFTIRYLSFADEKRKRITQIFMVGSSDVLIKIKKESLNTEFQ